MAQKRSLSDEIDFAQNDVSQIVCWCITVALHEKFGIGSSRLDLVAARMNELEEENTDLLIKKGKAAAEKTRIGWLDGVVYSEFRIPRVKMPKGNRERQILIASDKAASIAWTLYAKACMDVLGFGSGRMKRLLEESNANVRQFYQTAYGDIGNGKYDPELVECARTQAVQQLKNCAERAVRCELNIVDPDEDDLKKQMSDYEKEFVQRKVRELSALAPKSPFLPLSEKKLDECSKILKEMLG